MLFNQYYHHHYPSIVHGRTITLRRVISGKHPVVLLFNLNTSLAYQKKVFHREKHQFQLPI